MTFCRDLTGLQLPCYIPIKFKWNVKREPGSCEVGRAWYLWIMSCWSLFEMPCSGLVVKPEPHGCMYVYIHVFFHVFGHVSAAGALYAYAYVCIPLLRSEPLTRF